jgi:Ran GTPase-activating protein 1
MADEWNVQLQIRDSLEKNQLLSINAILNEYPHLETIYLSNRGIKNEAVQCIAKALTWNIKDLHLLSNEIEDQGAFALANMLAKNTTLQRLRLSFNRIGDQGCRAIAKACLQNTTLRTLELYDNRFGEKGARAIAKVMTRNTSLQRLFVYNGSISAKGIWSLTRALRKNFWLEEFDFEKKFSKRNQAALRKRLQFQIFLFTPQ